MPTIHGDAVDLTRPATLHIDLLPAHRRLFRTGSSRDVDGALRMRHEVALQGEYLLHAMHFAARRYLVIEIGGGVMACGYRAWDFEEERWTEAVVQHWDDRSLVGVDDGRARAAVSDGSGVDIIDIASGRTEPRLPLVSPSSVAFHPSRVDVLAAAGDSDAADGSGWIAMIDGPTMTTVRTERDEQRVAWLDATRLVHSEGTRLVLRDAGAFDRARDLATMSSAVRTLSTADGRCVVATGRTSNVYDAHGHAAPRQLEGIACVAGARIVWATDCAAGELLIEGEPPR